MFAELEPWEKQLFVSVQGKCNFLIPVSDEVAYVHYPQYNWVYNKIKICETQNIAAYPHGVRPTQYPVFSKPITNLYGMSEQAQAIDHWSGDDDYKPGHFWMPVLRGKQYSTDLVVIDGAILWYYSMRAVKKNETFESWNTHEIPVRLLEKIAKWIQEYLPDFTGILNFETIGDKIIECHLRMAEQWVDLYGEDWLESVIELYRDHKWTFTGTRQNGISRVLWIAHDCYPCVLDEGKLQELKQHATSIQLTWREGHPLSHESGSINNYRVAVINGFDSDAVERVAQELKEIIGERDEAGCNLLEWD